MNTYSSNEHPVKAISPIETTDDEIEICFKDSHHLNTLFLILAIEDGYTNVILANNEHPLNISHPISVKNDGIETFVNDVHLKKAEVQIFVTDDGAKIHYFRIFDFK